MRKDGPCQCILLGAICEDLECCRRCGGRATTRCGLNTVYKNSTTDKSLFLGQLEGKKKLTERVIDVENSVK